MRLPLSAGPVAVGSVAGLAWAASLRGWMIQIAGHESVLGWQGTFLLILLPGVAVGALLGWADHLRRGGALHGTRQRWLVVSPLLFAAALFDPQILQALITTGKGGGSIGVIIIGLTGGYALSARGPRWATTLTGLLALTFIVGAGLIPVQDAPITTAHGAWVTVHFMSMMAVFCVACSIPHRATPTPT